nr:L-glutamate gamma-semialdehyde dehydrogenase [Candidatus Delongbacteria bacterium]
MANAFFSVPSPRNEEIKDYRPQSAEKAAVKAKLAELSSQSIDIPLIIGGKEIRTSQTGTCIMPHCHGHRLGSYSQAGPAEVNLAITAAIKAKAQWEELGWEHRAAIFLKAADLLSGPYRATINAAAMLNLSKTVFQAEIDAACELADFFRFNAYYLQQIYHEQPTNQPGIWNRLEYRPLEGFVFAVSPFNFVSIGGNLAGTPALTGNVVLWKPASSAVYPAYFVMKLLAEAGLPDGVINFVPGNGSQVGDTVLASPDLAGIHFTGSTAVFQSMWRYIGRHIDTYRSYPRIVGETGGKDFIFVHPSADPKSCASAMIRGAFEFQGQKCSAASRAYIPQEMWGEIRDLAITMTAEIKVGDPADFTHFMGAVIDHTAFRNITSYIELAKSQPDDYQIICGGGYSDRTGYFIDPTIILSKSPDSRLMREEIFGPVLTVYLYPASKVEETLHLCNTTSGYGLTGSIMARDRYAIVQAESILRHAAGNFYINDKPTGAVVGQQPFGGARASGTNDKAGSYLNLLRWISV